MRHVPDKVLAAERQAGWVRFVLACGGALYLVLHRYDPRVSLPLAIATLAVIWIYTVYVLVFEPYRRFDFLRSSYLTTIGDSILSTLWLAATGGYASDWFALYFAQVAATAYRFNVRETVLATGAYALAWLLMLWATGTWPVGAAGGVAVRLLLLGATAALCGPMARDSVEQALARASIQRLAEEKEAAERKRREVERRIRSERIRVEEAERRNLALELHDEIGQVLTGLKLALDVAERRGDTAALEQCRAQLDDLTTRVRNLSLDLRPAVLDDLGLLPALLKLVERYEQRTRISVELHHHGLDRRFDPELETVAYRIVQEALTNVARHSGARTAVVRLWADGETCTLEIEDAGCGFDETGEPPGTGLVGMRERAALLGGSVLVESAAGRGTRVLAELPLASGDEPRKMSA